MSEETTTDPEVVDDHTEREQAHYIAICETEMRVYESEQEYVEAKDEASAKKKTFEGAASALRAMIRHGPNQQTMLPFEDVEKKAWEFELVTELDIPDGLASKLVENDTETLGGLAEWLKTHELIEIAGVGEEKALMIADAFADYFKDHEIEEVAGEGADNA